MKMKQFKFPFNKKKTLLYTAITLTGITTSSLVLAASNNNPSNPANPTNTQGIIAAINQLGNKIEALAVSGVKTVNNAVYQIDKDLPTIIQANTAKSIASASASQQENNKTANEIKNTLTQIPDSALTYSVQTPDVTAVLKRQQQQQNLVNQLTLNTPASDTPYSDVFGVDGTSFDTQGYSVAKPKTLYDNYFNFNSLFSPSGYTANQKKAAKNYIEYLTKRYQPLITGVNFDKLKSKLNQLKSRPNELAEALHNFMNTDAFKQYQLSIRSITASRSLGLSNFNDLIAERSPIETSSPNDSLRTLSKAIGLQPTYHGTFYNPTLKKYVYASPLQISNYTANRRVNSSQWYSAMATASPATVQRETLYVLAEIESQMHQAHLDRERLLATLTAMQMASSDTGQLMLQTQANAVNQAIDNIGKTEKSEIDNH